MCLEDLGSKKRRFHDVLEKELAKDGGRDDDSTENKWVKLREVVKNGAKEVYGFQETRRAKLKRWTSEENGKITTQKKERRNTQA